MNEDIAVLLPVYNEIETIERCVDSILGQVDVNVRIYCQDNLSSDGTYEYLLNLSLKHENVTLFRTDRTLPIWDNFNTLFEKVMECNSNKYFTWIGADDFYLKDSHLFQLKHKIEIENLSGVTPQIRAFRQNPLELDIPFGLQFGSRFKLLRIFNFLRFGKNVNAIHGLFDFEKISDIFISKDSRFDENLNSDWWILLEILSRGPLKSASESIFCKSVRSHSHNTPIREINILKIFSNIFSDFGNLLGIFIKSRSRFMKLSIGVRVIIFLQMIIKILYRPFVNVLKLTFLILTRAYRSFYNHTVSKLTHKTSS